MVVIKEFEITIYILHKTLMCKSFSVEVIHAHYSWTSKYCKKKNCVDRKQNNHPKVSHDKNHFHNFFAICSNCLHTISATKYQTSIEIKKFICKLLGQESFKNFTIN